MTPEFTRKVALAKLSANKARFSMSASESVREALAKRFDLQEIGLLDAELEVWRVASGARASGEMVADVVQTCAISGEPVSEHIRTTVELLFEEGDESFTDMELDPDEPDHMPVEDGQIDLGEALAQSLYLALEPYPRADEEVLAKARQLLLSEEEEARRQAGLQAEEKAANNPFPILKKK